MKQKVACKLNKRRLFNVERTVNVDDIYQAYSGSRKWNCLSISHIEYQKPFKMSVPRLPPERPRVERKRRPASVVEIGHKKTERPLSCRVLRLSGELSPNREQLKLKDDPIDQKRKKISLSSCRKPKKITYLHVPKIRVNIRNKTLYS